MRLIVLFFAVCSVGACTPAARTSNANAPQTHSMSQTPNLYNSNLDTLTLGGGCFWCLEAVYQRLRGVERVVSGYAGGHAQDPSYEAVCKGITGHAEVIQLVFDNTQIGLEDLLYVFWRLHDPTTPNRQGADVGTQYRSIILYRNDLQREAAIASRMAADSARIWPNQIVTEIVPLTVFYPAEAYHQGYYNGHRQQPYCQFVIDPKIQKLRRDFQPLLRAE